MLNPPPGTGRDLSAFAVRNSDAIDSLVWSFLSALLLMSIRVGRLSGDGLVQTHDYLAHTWRLNPNHLLYEPVGAAWLSSIRQLGLTRPAVDQMVLLSVAAGALALGLFRRFVACNASSRTAANAATAWVAFSAAFLSLWLSSEAQMVQMPWLVASYAAALAYSARPTTARAAAAGLAIGTATLFYVSNGLLAVSIPIALAIGAGYAGKRYSAKQLATILGVAVLVAASAFIVAWLLTAAGSISLIAWLTTYGGGHGSSRIVGTYGVHRLAELPIAIARAAYGTASGVVDISGAVANLRTTGTVLLSSLVAVAVCVGVLGLLTYSVIRAVPRRDQTAPTILIAAAWLAAVFAFGVFWNNSDDQFYFQMSIALGALIASMWVGQSRIPLMLATLALVSWNGVAAWRGLIAYPRDEYVAGLAANVAGAGLVIFPGSDEIMQLMYFVPTDLYEKRINLTSIAATSPAAIGLPTVVKDVDCALSHGRRVVMLDVAAPGAGDSWRALSALGYARDRVMTILGRYAFTDPHLIGPFVAHRLVAKYPDAFPTCDSAVH